MISNLWQWLVRLDARHIAMGSAALLAFALAGYARQVLLAAADATAVPPAGPPSVTAPEPQPPWPGEGPGPAPRSPFASQHLNQLVALSAEGLLVWDDPGQTNAADTVAAEPDPEPPSPEPDPPPEPKPIRKVRLRYLGLLTRTDGRTVAMVEHGEPPAIGIYRPGDAVEGFRVDTMDRNRLNVREDGGEIQGLPKGQATVLESEHGEP